MMTDVTAQHRYQEQVEHIAFHDALTGLPNRLLLADRVGQAAAGAVRSGHLAAVAYLDLDGFKAVNDTHGHEAGDQLLREVARRMEGCVRAGDTVARVGGDEFVLVLCGLTDTIQCDHILQRVLQEIAKPIRVLGGVDVAVSGSIGVAVCPTDSQEPRDLMSAADGAMYAAKRAGKRCISYATSP
jgi:diguanylate cyclase (GGDEF)-like protein